MNWVIPIRRRCNFALEKTLYEHPPFPLSCFPLQPVFSSYGMNCCNCHLGFNNPSSPCDQILFSNTKLRVYMQASLCYKCNFKHVNLSGFTEASKLQIGKIKSSEEQKVEVAWEETASAEVSGKVVQTMRAVGELGPRPLASNLADQCRYSSRPFSIAYCRDDSLRTKYRELCGHLPLQFPFGKVLDWKSGGRVTRSDDLRIGPWKRKLEGGYHKHRSTGRIGDDSSMTVCLPHAHENSYIKLRILQHSAKASPKSSCHPRRHWPQELYTIRQAGIPGRVSFGHDLLHLCCYDVLYEGRGGGQLH